MHQTHQVRKHISVPVARAAEKWHPPSTAWWQVARAAGCPVVQKCNISYCRDWFADAKLLEAAPDAPGGFNEGSSIIQMLCTAPGSADTLQ